MIRWEHDDTPVLLNPRLAPADAAAVRALIGAVPPLPAHVWLTTSGSTGRLKPVALAKRALLASADAVNAHLAGGPDDVWLNVLPVFHVGGLGVHARAHLSGAAVETLSEWDPAAFHDRIAARRVTLTSVVPAQVFDLVRAGLRAPPTLRAVIVGGGALPADLYDRGRALGWPLLPSYGATEAGSQIATARPDDPDPAVLPLLGHVEARTDDDGRIAVRGPSLLTGYATPAGLEDPKRDGWWRTDDLGRVDGRLLTVLGRADDTVKVGGELVALAVLETRLRGVLAAVAPGCDAALAALPDPRLGAVLVLAVATPDAAAGSRVRDAFNDAVLPFERIRDVRPVPAVPRTPLGKVARAELLRLLGAGPTAPDR